MVVKLWDNQNRRAFIVQYVRIMVCTTTNDPEVQGFSPRKDVEDSDKDFHIFLRF